MSVTRKNEHEERQGKDDRKDPMLPADQRLLSSCRSFRAKTLSPLHCLFSCFLLSDSVLSRLIHPSYPLLYSPPFTRFVHEKHTSG